MQAVYIMNTETNMACIVFISLLLVICVTSAPVKNIHLSRLSTLYLPHKYYRNGTGQFAYNGGAAEQLAYDKSGKLLYVVGKYIFINKYKYLFLLKKNPNYLHDLYF